MTLAALLLAPPASQCAARRGRRAPRRAGARLEVQAAAPPAAAAERPPPQFTRLGYPRLQPSQHLTYGAFLDLMREQQVKELVFAREGTDRSVVLLKDGTARFVQLPSDDPRVFDFMSTYGAPPPPSLRVVARPAAGLVTGSGVTGDSRALPSAQRLLAGYRFQLPARALVHTRSCINSMPSPGGGGGGRCGAGVIATLAPPEPPPPDSVAMRRAKDAAMYWIPTSLILVVYAAVQYMARTKGDWEACLPAAGCTPRPPTRSRSAPPLGTAPPATRPCIVQQPALCARPHRTASSSERRRRRSGARLASAPCAIWRRRTRNAAAAPLATLAPKARTAAADTTRAAQLGL